MVRRIKFIFLIIISFFFIESRADVPSFELKCDVDDCVAPRPYKILVDGVDITEKFKFVFDLDEFYSNFYKLENGALYPKGEQICFPSFTYELLLKSIISHLELNDDENTKDSLNNFLNESLQQYFSLNQGFRGYFFTHEHYECYVPHAFRDEPNYQINRDGSYTASSPNLDESFINYRFGPNKVLDNFPIESIRRLHNISLDCYSYYQDGIVKPRVLREGDGNRCSGLNVFFNDKESLNRTFPAIQISDEMVGQSFFLPSGYWVKGIENRGHLIN